MTSPLSRIRIVLVRPSHPGNIGATARAMKTMGLSQLCLVSPERFPHAEATALAVNAADVLNAAQPFVTLDAALSGTALQIAFTARSRSLSHAPLTVRAAAAEALRVAEQQSVALVFGNETYGLSNEEVMCCNRAASIPANAACTSLNLAAAVQVAAYELRMAGMDRSGQGHKESTPANAKWGELASHEEVERFYAHLEQSIHASGFLQPNNPRRLMERMRRLFGRARLEKEEINIWRGMLAAWDEASRKAHLREAEKSRADGASGSKVKGAHEGNGGPENS
mgnify:CR=1 FL=1